MVFYPGNEHIKRSRSLGNIGSVVPKMNYPVHRRRGVTTYRIRQTPQHLAKPNYFTSIKYKPHGSFDPKRSYGLYDDYWYSRDRPELAPYTWVGKYAVKREDDTKMTSPYNTWWTFPSMWYNPAMTRSRVYPDLRDANDPLSYNRCYDPYKGTKGPYDMRLHNALDTRKAVDMYLNRLINYYALEKYYLKPEEEKSKYWEGQYWDDRYYAPGKYLHTYPRNVWGN